MSDWISREDALEILEDEGWVGDSLRRIRALPAVQPNAREAALREAAFTAWAVEDGDRWTRAAAQSAILALIGEPAHVNETPKSEHDARNMLTPATKGDTHD